MLSVVIPVEAQPTIGCFSSWDQQATHNSWEGVTTFDGHHDQSVSSKSQTDVEEGRYEGDIGSALAGTFKQLLGMYSAHVNATGANPNRHPVSSGGLQQFINRNSNNRQQAQQIQGQGPIPNAATFLGLPENVQLNIFSYLDTRDLCIACGVCWQFNNLASDNLLWRRKLERDVHKWNVISYTTNPDMYQECQSDWSNKEIYLQCSPEINLVVKQSNIAFHHLSSMLRSLWPRKTPKLAMFGPGLESDTSPLTRKILEDKSGLFVATGMFPGQFEGVGSGFTLRLRNSSSFHLVTLYTSTRAERQGLAPSQRMQHNRLLGPAAAQAADPEAQGHEEEPEAVPEMRQSVKNLCRTLDGLIFVVDASQDAASVKAAHSELRAMVNELWVSPNIPLMVLSCIPEASSCRRWSVMEVVQTLRLGQLSRPWQAHNCVVESMEGVEGAMEWAVEQAQRR